MRLEAKKYLHDVREAAARITKFTEGKKLDDYTRDDMLRAAVERQFEIVGEALNQLAKLDAVLAARIAEYRRIIAFRNILVHGYAEIDDRLVWDIVATKLRTLLRDVDALLNED